jgi:hypothetical protein
MEDRVAATGLSANPAEYRARLGDQPDEQIDAWAAELMRDMAKRKGVIGVIDRFKGSAALSDGQFERVFSAGGGPPASIGRDAAGNQVVPAVALWALVPGLRAQAADARAKLIEYLVASFHDIVFV